MKFQQAVNPTTLVTLPFIIIDNIFFFYTNTDDVYIGIQSFFDISVHINVLTKRFFLFDPKYLISAIELKTVF